MNTRLVNQVAREITTAMESGRRTPAGWAMALEAKGFLMSPEVAAELESLRAEVLAEGAALVEDRACNADFTESPAFCAGLREAVEVLNRAAGEKSSRPAADATPYAVRPCVCDETPHPTWCPASVPTDERITEIRQGTGGPLTRRELSWLTGAATRHELHVTGARGGHWPLTDDLPGALLLVSQYLAAAVAVIDRAGLTEEESSREADATPALTVYRASHDSIVMGLYTTREAARAHCEAEERLSQPNTTGLAFAWIPDDSDPMSPEELSVFAPGEDPEDPEETFTGYVVTPLEVASKYDEEADR